MVAVVYDGLAGLPQFNPDDDRDPLPGPVAALRQAIADSDAVLFCTPEYAGTLPGSVKNLLDWTVGGTEMSDKRVAWMNAAADPRRGGAHTPPSPWCSATSRLASSRTPAGTSRSPARPSARTG